MGMLWVDFDYGYSNARVKALKSKLFNRDRLREIMDVSTLPEFIEMLEESPYKQALVFASVTKTGLDLVKRALDDDLMQAFNEVVNFSPKKARPFLQFYLQYWQVNNLKKILALRSKSQSATNEDLITLDSASGKFFAPFLAAKDLKGVIDAFSGTEFYPAISKAKEEYAKTGDYRVFLTSLDDYYYSQLSRQASLVHDAYLEKFIMLRIDALNAMTVLRMKESKVPPEVIRKHLIRSSHDLFSNSIITTQSVHSAIDLIEKRTQTKFSESAVRAALEGHSLAQIEVELEAVMLREARKTLRLSVLSLGTLVGYLYLKQEEVHALRKIAYATVLDVKDAVRKTIYVAE